MEVSGQVHGRVAFIPHEIVYGSGWIRDKKNSLFLPRIEQTYRHFTNADKTAEILKLVSDKT
jgi:hypothetical protein